MNSSEAPVRNSFEAFHTPCRSYKPYLPHLERSLCLVMMMSKVFVFVSLCVVCCLPTGWVPREDTLRLNEQLKIEMGAGEGEKLSKALQNPKLNPETCLPYILCLY